MLGSKLCLCTAKSEGLLDLATHAETRNVSKVCMLPSENLVVIYFTGRAPVGVMASMWNLGVAFKSRFSPSTMSILCIKTVVSSDLVVR